VASGHTDLPRGRPGNGVLAGLALLLLWLGAYRGKTTPGPTNRVGVVDAQACLVDGDGTRVEGAGGGEVALGVLDAGEPSEARDRTTSANGRKRLPTCAIG
jgi:hypothetical protein